MNFDKKKIFLIAPETSGSQIASSLSLYIDKNYKNKFEIEGIFSKEASLIIGKKSLFDIKHTAVMGIYDVILKIFKIKKLIKNSALYIKNYNPDFVISIDSYDFCISVTKSLYKINYLTNKSDIGTKFFHIVSPSVWIYRKNRANAIAKYYHHLFYLLNFEKNYYSDLNIKTSFVGFVNISKIKMQNIHDRQKIIILTLGSRLSEVKSNKLLLKKLAFFIKDNTVNYRIFVPTTDITNELVANIFDEYSLSNLAEYSNSPKVKEDFYNKASFTIGKSGTNVMESIAKGIPTIVYYSMGLFNYTILFLLKKLRLFKVRFFTIINIVNDKEIVKEFLFKNKIKAKESKLIIDYLINNFITDKFDIKKHREQIDTCIKKMKKENFEKIICDKIIESCK